MQRQFSGKDSDTPSFLEGEDEQVNKPHYEKVEWENWISLMQSISLQSKTLQSSQKARGISTNAWILTMAVWFQF